MFSTPSTTPGEPVDDEKERNRRYSTISPNISDIGAQSPSNEHIERLGGILLTYNFYETELGAFSVQLIQKVYIKLISNEGYVQGMSDLCAPVYVVMASNEEMTFWCFVEVMNRMVRTPQALILLQKHADTMTETKLFSRSKRNEETAVDPATTHRSNGSGVVSSFRCI